MASAAQIRANRENAKLSTGPTSRDGKHISRYNACKHGLLGRRTVVETDDIMEFCQFYYDMHDSLDAEGRVEEMLAERVIALAWRLQRASKIETDILVQGWRIARQQGEGVKMGRAFRWDSDGSNAIEKIRRYETSLERSFYRALHELERIQTRRHGGHVPVPAVLDVQVDSPSRQTRLRTRA